MLVEAAWSYRYPARLAKEKAEIVGPSSAKGRPRYRMEGADEALRPFPKTRRCRQKTDRRRRGHCTRTFRLRLGYRPGGDAGRFINPIAPKPVRPGSKMGSGQSSIRPLGRFIPTPVNRPRQARDDTRSCGIQIREWKMFDRPSPLLSCSRPNRQPLSAFTVAHSTHGLTGGALMTFSLKKDMEGQRPSPVVTLSPALGGVTAHVWTAPTRQEILTR